MIIHQTTLPEVLNRVEFTNLFFTVAGHFLTTQYHICQFFSISNLLLFFIRLSFSPLLTSILSTLSLSFPHKDLDFTNLFYLYKRILLYFAQTPLHNSESFCKSSIFICLFSFVFANKNLYSTYDRPMIVTMIDLDCKNKSYFILITRFYL